MSTLSTLKDFHALRLEQQRLDAVLAAAQHEHEAGLNKLYRAARGVLFRHFAGEESFLVWRTDHSRTHSNGSITLTHGGYSLACPYSGSSSTGEFVRVGLDDLTREETLKLADQVSGRIDGG